MKMRKLFAGLAAAATLLSGMAIGVAAADEAVTHPTPASIATVATAAMTRRVNRPVPLALFRSKTCLIRLPPCTVKRSGKYLPPSTGIFDASSLHIPSDNRFVA